MERTIQRHRQRKHPPSPKTLEDVKAVFENESVLHTYGQTKSLLHSKPFFKTVHIGKNFGYCMFASDRCIELMEQRIPTNERKFYIDATFKVVPTGGFKQLLIIFVELYKQVGSYSKFNNSVLFFFSLFGTIPSVKSGMCIGVMKKLSNNYYNS